VEFGKRGAPNGVLPIGPPPSSRPGSTIGNPGTPGAPTRATWWPSSSSWGWKWPEG